MEVQQPPTKIPKLSEGEEEREKVIKLLEERLAKHDESRKSIQDKIHEICEGLRTQINELEDRVNKELEEKFIFEDNRFQAALNGLRGNNTSSTLQKAKIELLVEQSYELIRNKEVKLDLTALCELKAERHIAPELAEAWKPANVRVTGVNRGSVSVQFTCLNPDEERVPPENASVNSVKYKCLLFKKDNEQKSKEEYPLVKDEDDDSFLFTPDILEPETTYGIKVKMIAEDRECGLSDKVAEFTTLEFKECCTWKKCPDDVDDNRKYSVDEGNPRVATKDGSDFCTIIGNTPIPLNKVTSWSIKILKSRNNDGHGIYIGIAPFGINQNVNYNYDECGWYFDCCSSVLCSGPPHNYSGNEYGPRKEEEGYMCTPGTVWVLWWTRPRGTSHLS